MCSACQEHGNYQHRTMAPSKTVVKLGGVGAGSATDDIPKVLAATIGLPLQLVPATKAPPMFGWPLTATKSKGSAIRGNRSKRLGAKSLQSGDVVIVLQTIAKPHPELSKLPLAINYAKTDEAQKLIKALVHSVGPTARPYVLPPGTPKDRVQILRKAFMDTMKDPEFLADANKAKLDINPLDGAELEKNVKEVFNLDPALIPRAKEILK